MKHLAVLFALIVAGLGCNPGYRIESEQLFKQLRVATDPTKLRAWVAAASTGVERNNGSNSWMLPKEKWPAWLESVRLDHGLMGVTIYVTKESTNARIVWGDGRGLCGLDVSTGSNGFVLPNKDFHALTWEPGIYVWHNSHE